MMVEDPICAAPARLERRDEVNDSRVDDHPRDCGAPELGGR